jgi:FMN-dependent NADH-azoreductase
MKLLEIQSSVRVERSISRTLSREFIQAWQEINPGENATENKMESCAHFQ